MRINRRFALGAAVLSLALVAAACGKSGGGGATPSGSPSSSPTQKGTLTVGVSGNFAENQIVAEMYAQVLEKAGYTVKRQLDLASREISEKALDSGQIDLKPEYLSSLLLFLDPNGKASGDTNAMAQQDSTLLQAKGNTLLTPSPAQDTNVFVANKETGDKFSLTKMSDLAAVAGQLTLGGPPECPQRPFCIIGLKDTYGITFKDFKPLDVGGPQTVAALKSNAVQIGLLFSTDPSIIENGFVPLEDDKHLQNAENITPVIRTDKLNDEIRGLLDAVSSKLTTQNMTELVGKVVNDKMDAATVAKDFLTSQGLL
jgi:osmoprotectant transport system substrate-binding protein